MLDDYDILLNTTAAAFKFVIERKREFAAQDR